MEFFVDIRVLLFRLNPSLIRLGFFLLTSLKNNFRTGMGITIRENNS